MLPLIFFLYVIKDADPEFVAGVVLSVWAAIIAGYALAQLLWQAAQSSRRDA